MKHHNKALTSNELINIIIKWVTTKPPYKYLTPDFSFKMGLQKMASLRNSFISDCLCYLVYRKFSWLLSDYNEESLIGMNNQLKTQYRKLLFEQFFRSSNLFELFIVYLIKLNTAFIEYYFTNIQIDSAFEAEVCIILYYTFLGVEINQKTYKLLENKFISKRNYSKDNHSVSMSNHSSKFSKTAKNSIFQANKSALKISSYEKPQKSTKFIRHSRMSFVRPVKQLIKRQNLLDDINNLLKQNLHVDPLPPLKKKRINIRQFQRLNTQPTQTLHQKQNQQKKQIENDHFQNKKKHIFSNQLSPSIKTCYPYSLLFQLNSKKVKLNQTVQNFPRERSLHLVKNQKQRENNSLDGKELDFRCNSNGKKMQTNDWTKLVGDLKKKVFNLRWNTDQQGKKKKIKQKQLDQTVLEKNNSNTEVIDELKVTITKVNKTVQSDNESQQDTVINFDNAQLNKLSFKKGTEKSYFRVQNFQDGSQKDFNNLYRLSQNQRRGRKLVSSILRLDQDLFFGLCDERKGSIMGVKKVNLHDDWILNQYKQ